MARCLLLWSLSGDQQTSNGHAIRSRMTRCRHEIALPRSVAPIIELKKCSDFQICCCRAGYVLIRPPDVAIPSVSAVSDFTYV